MRCCTSWGAPRLETLRPTDAVASWFDEATARRSQAAGWVTLDDVRRAIDRGGRWWRSMPGVGQVKAGRLAEHLASLLPPAAASQWLQLADAFSQHVANSSGAPGSGGTVSADAAREPIEFLLAFLEATGLRASKLVQAWLGDWRQVNRGWVLQVLGKGGKARLVVVPAQAAQALDQVPAAARLVNVDPLDDELAGLPLVASTLDPHAPVSYSALYRSTKTWFSKAIWSSELSIQDKLDASKASLHWLRHTCGTRELDRDVSVETV